MRELKSRGFVIAARGSNLARLYYTQRFDGDFDSALEGLGCGGDFVNAANTLYRMIWAMNKAENFYLRKPTPDFGQWLGEFLKTGFDISDCIDDLLAEITEGFTVTRSYGKGGKGQVNDANLPQKIISVALKMGMTMDEINEMTTQTLIDIMHEYVAESKKDGKRLATPAEASAFFGGFSSAGRGARRERAGRLRQGGRHVRFRVRAGVEGRRRRGVIVIYRRFGTD